MQEMKIRINNPEHSKQVQKVLFDMGYEWAVAGKKIAYSRYPYLYCHKYGSIACGDGKKTFVKNSKPEYHLKDGKLVPVKTANMDNRFPFKLSQDQAKRIVKIACSSWKDKLFGKWGKELLFNNSITITEEFYQEMRAACTTEQHKLFDEIFGADKSVEEIVKSIPLPETGKYWDLTSCDEAIIISTPPANFEIMFEIFDWVEQVTLALRERNYNAFPVITRTNKIAIKIQQ